MPAANAFIFDLDGTLVDSMPSVIAGYLHALAPWRKLTEAELHPYLGAPPLKTMLEITGDPAAALEAVRRFAAFAPCPALFPGAANLLETLHANGRPLALWTGRDRAASVEILRKRGIEKYFATIVCGDDLPTHKPDPEGLRLALQKLNVPAAEAVFTGDSDVDLMAGAEAGVRTVLVTHEKRFPAELAAKAWRLAATPAAAYALLAAPPEGAA
ncbi:MAG: HAD family hydrolase [Opitutaceae bacterium]|jgi:HAD superfamily hydrolase (TIGR01509 family)|nr:HAD family hydrolase [Opitutaceae bacterium]